MGQFIAQYWLEALFTLALGVLTYFVKKFYSLWQYEQQAKKANAEEELKNELKSYNEDLMAAQQIFVDHENLKLQETIEEVKEENKKLLSAVLEVQRKQFKNDCYRLLEDDVIISIDQFENIYNEYVIYESLGGNGYGSTLFDLVKDKYCNQSLTADTTTAFIQNPRLRDFYKKLANGELEKE